MRFLFAMFQGGGNTRLILPVVARLIEMGHAVRILAGPGIRPSRMPINQSFLDRIEAAGAELALLEVPSPHPLDAAPAVRGLLLGKTPTSLSREVALARITCWSEAWARQTLLELTGFRADVLAADFHLPGALAAGEAEHVPCAALVHTLGWRPLRGTPPHGMGFFPARSPRDTLRDLLWNLAINRIHARDGTPMHNLARENLGLPQLRSWFDQYDAAQRVLVFADHDFDFPAQIQSNVRYIGTPFDDTRLNSSDWTPPWPAADNERPSVLVSLSTLAQGQRPLLERIIDALGSLHLRGVVTVGPALGKPDFVAPANVFLYDFVPHAAVLPHVSAMVTQCGIGSLTKALAHGVPVVCIPLAADQPDNAARVVALGGGVRIEPDSDTTAIAAAITMVLEDQRFREAARAIGERLASQDGAQNSAHELISLGMGRQ